MLALTPRLVLASQSPRRRALLRQIGLSFDVDPANVDESLPAGVAPGNAVEDLALRKADEVARRHPEALTLAGDTLVALGDDLLEKPADPFEARTMLRRLSGVTHAVHTGLALVHPASGRRVVAHETTAVTFASLSDAEIRAYVDTGSPLDKAGSYGIQDDLGALLVERIEGDYYNVVGLPLCRLYTMLKEHFGDCLVG